MTETVTRLRTTSSGEDAFGQPIPAVTIEVNFEATHFAPGGTSEPVEVGRSPVISEPTLYFRNQWPDITEHDQVRVRGKKYDVMGVPADWRHEDAPGGLVVRLKRAGG